nr:hypothetical protein CFP56_00479 [Quercus suber]
MATISPQGSLPIPIELTTVAQRSITQGRQRRQYLEVDFDAIVQASNGSFEVTHDGNPPDLHAVGRGFNVLSTLGVFSQKLMLRFTINGRSSSNRLDELLRGLQPLERENGQCLFVSVQSSTPGRSAVLIPCSRPREHRRIFRTKYTAQGEREYHYRKIEDGENSLECDSDIYDRLLQSCYQHLGTWRQWLPFYGVTDAHEIEFEFRGSRNVDGTFAIILHSIDLESIRSKADKMISLAESDQDDFCSDGYHSGLCDPAMDFLHEPCLQVQAETSRRRKMWLDSLHLLPRWVQCPMLANGECSLAGMALDSCIYDLSHGHVQRIADNLRLAERQTAICATAWTRLDCCRAFSHMALYSMVLRLTFGSNVAFSSGGHILLPRASSASDKGALVLFVLALSIPAKRPFCPFAIMHMFRSPVRTALVLSCAAAGLCRLCLTFEHCLCISGIHVPDNLVRSIILDRPRFALLCQVTAARLRNIVCIYINPPTIESITSRLSLNNDHDGAKAIVRWTIVSVRGLVSEGGSLVRPEVWQRV